VAVWLAVGSGLLTDIMQWCPEGRSLVLGACCRGGRPYRPAPLGARMRVPGWSVRHRWSAGWLCAPSALARTAASQACSCGRLDFRGAAPPCCVCNCGRTPVIPPHAGSEVLLLT